LLIEQVMETEECMGQYLGVVDVKCRTDREDLTARNFVSYFSQSIFRVINLKTNKTARTS